MTDAPTFYTFDAPLRPRRPRSPWPAALYTLVPMGIILAIIAVISPLTAGILYATCVVVLSFWRPYIALMLAFALAPFVQDLISQPFNVSIGELTMVLCLPAFLLTGLRHLRFPVFMFFTLLYIAACFASCLANADRGGNSEAITAIVQMVLYLVIAVILYSSFVRNPQNLIFILEGSMVVTVFLAVLTFLPDSMSPGLHKNSLGASMASALVVAIECWFAASKNRRRRWVLLSVVVFLAVALLYTKSRGAWLGAVGGVLVIMALRRQFKLFGILIAVLAPVLVGLFLMMPQEDQDYAAGFDSERWNIKARYNTISYTMDQFNENRILGVGIALRKNVDATNIVCISLAESGIIGFAAFVLMHVAVLRSTWKTQKLIPRSDPLYSPAALGGALVVVHVMHGLVDHYWSRGPILQAWAAAGMSTAVYFHVRRRRARAARERKVMMATDGGAAFGGPMDFQGQGPARGGAEGL